MADPLTIFTDGACSGNPGPGGWGAIVLRPDGMVRELGGGEARTTNNRMEMTAAIEALREVVREKAPVELFTDSTYVIHGIERWIAGWKRGGWRRKDGGDVVNRDLWETLDRLAGARPDDGSVRWRYVKGHAGIPGNERCDEIAVAFSREEEVDLYRGPLTAYPVDLSVRPAQKALSPPPAAARQAASQDAKPVYLSLVGRKLERHDTWAACNARVKGVPGARYKKVRSPEEEAMVLKSWGVGL